MSLARRVPAMAPEKVQRVKDTLVEAGIAMEMGGDWKGVFRRAKNRRIGVERQIYALAESSSFHAIRDAIVELIPDYDSNP